ncbi:MAG: aminodeoxychorismate/anthranilate synthase component II [Vicinamibacterales bacterium]
MVLVVDNYDSFTWNLVQFLGEIVAPEHLVVLRNDAATVAEVLAMKPSRIVISPGPGRPEQAGVSVELVSRAGPSVPILGVCLGHQAIGVAFGARVVRGHRPVHGKASPIEHDGRGVFAGMTGDFDAARYHSLVIAEESMPPALEVSARSRDDRTVMAVRHKSLPVHGVQFHPESVLTPAGRRILANFVQM